MMMNNYNDKKFREYLNAEKKEAPVNPWFVRKVLNRLPERENPYQWIIRTVSIIAIIVSFVVWPMLCESAVEAFSTSDITIHSVMAILAPVLVGIAAIGLLVFQVYLAFRN